MIHRINYDGAHRPGDLSRGGHWPFGDDAARASAWPKLPLFPVRMGREEARKHIPPTWQRSGYPGGFRKLQACATFLA